MDSITVELAERSYPVLIGSGLLSDPESFARALGPRSLVVTSETVAGLHLDALRTTLGDHPHEVVVLPDGDDAKSLTHVAAIIDSAIDAGIGRDGTIVALGGGAIGDVAGFAAAVYQRGIGVVQVPTTLLAQVDSSIGGKTAVNHPAGKNLIGAFHQPRRVVIDTATLATLPESEFAAGLAEVIKTGLLDGRLFESLEAEVKALLAQDQAVLTDTIRRCCAFKAAVVAADETEVGDRALLNLGHSFGHALEAHYRGGMSHGEAVGIGCLMAAHLSRALGWLEPGFPARLRKLIERCGLPTALPEPRPKADALLEFMRRDKKNLAGRIRLVLLRGPGDAVVSIDHPHAALVLTLMEFTGEGA